MHNADLRVTTRSTSVRAPLLSLFLISCAAAQPHDVILAGDRSVSSQRHAIDLPAQVLERYDRSTQVLHLLGWNASRPVVERAVHIPNHLELRAVPDTAVVKSYFYYVVNDTLWGATVDSLPVAREAITEISTIKISLRTGTGEHAVAGFMFIDAPAVGDAPVRDNRGTFSLREASRDRCNPAVHRRPCSADPLDARHADG